MYFLGCFVSCLEGRKWVEKLGRGKKIIKKKKVVSSGLKGA